MVEFNPNARSRKGWAYYIYGSVDTEKLEYHPSKPQKGDFLGYSQTNAITGTCTYQGGASELTTVEVQVNKNEIRYFHGQEPTVENSNSTYAVKIYTSGFTPPTFFPLEGENQIMILRGNSGRVPALFAPKEQMGELAAVNFGRESYSRSDSFSSYSITRSVSLICTTALGDPYGDDDGDGPCGGLMNPDGSCNCCAIAQRLNDIFAPLMAVP
ncbi:MAG: hypothetical protein F6J87_18325 [Spirulina sp. SIO3F2]|nr:hypothetical protein [Spirulina sp. SIO3F2]